MVVVVAAGDDLAWLLKAGVPTPRQDLDTSSTIILGVEVVVVVVVVVAVATVATVVTVAAAALLVSLMVVRRARSCWSMEDGGVLQ